MNTTNQTPAASASRHTAWTDYDNWTFRRCVEQRRDYLNSTEVRDAHGESVCNEHVQHLDEMEQKVKDCVNALAGMEPGAVKACLDILPRALGMLEGELTGLHGRDLSDGLVPELRAALAALKGGAK